MHFFLPDEWKCCGRFWFCFQFSFLFFSLLYTQAHVVAPRDLRQGIYRRPGIRNGLKTKKKDTKMQTFSSHHVTEFSFVFFFLARLDKEEDGGGRWLFGSIEQVGRMGWMWACLVRCRCGCAGWHHYQAFISSTVWLCKFFYVSLSFSFIFRILILALTNLSDRWFDEIRTYISLDRCWVTFEWGPGQLHT